MVVMAGRWPEPGGTGGTRRGARCSKCDSRAALGSPFTCGPLSNRTLPLAQPMWAPTCEQDGDVAVVRGQPHDVPLRQRHAAVPHVVRRHEAHGQRSAVRRQHLPCVGHGFEAGRGRLLAGGAGAPVTGGTGASARGAAGGEGAGAAGGSVLGSRAVSPRQHHVNHLRHSGRRHARVVACAQEWQRGQDVSGGRGHQHGTTGRSQRGILSVKHGTSEGRGRDGLLLKKPV